MSTNIFGRRSLPKLIHSSMLLFWQTFGYDVLLGLFCKMQLFKGNEESFINLGTILEHMLSGLLADVLNEARRSFWQEVD